MSQILDKDLRITATSASSKGGQNANRRHNNLRVLHVPTGIQVNIGGRSPYPSKVEAAKKEIARQLSLAEENERMAAQNAAEKKRRRERQYRKTTEDIKSDKRRAMTKELRRKIAA